MQFINFKINFSQTQVTNDSILVILKLFASVAPKDC